MPVVGWGGGGSKSRSSEMKGLLKGCGLQLSIPQHVKGFGPLLSRREILSKDKWCWLCCS